MRGGVEVVRREPVRIGGKRLFRHVREKTEEPFRVGLALRYPGDADIADLVVMSPDMAPQSLPLVAENDVAEAGFFGRAWAGFLSLFGM